MPYRSLFVVRTKLGDSLIALASLLAYRDRHPEDDIHLLIRRDYVPLIAGEAGIRLIPFGSRLEMGLRLKAMRLAGQRYDHLAVLCGYGRPAQKVAEMVAATRRLYLDDRFSAQYPEYPPPHPADSLVDGSMAVVRLLDPACPKPDRLHFPVLAARRAGIARAEAVAIAPLADELRRNMNAAAARQLVEEVRRRHPGKDIWLMANPRDHGAREILAAGLPVKLVKFRSIPQLINLMARLDAWYGTDTGLYHLAVAMGVPATVFFGATQPGKVTLSQQPGVCRVRLAALGNAHCEVKDCREPICLHRAVACWAGAGGGGAAPSAVPGCLVAGLAGEAWSGLAEVSTPPG